MAAEDVSDGSRGEGEQQYPDTAISRHCSSSSVQRSWQRKLEHRKGNEKEKDRVDVASCAWEELNKNKLVLLRKSEDEMRREETRH